jgi:hypothetical protein
MDHTTLSQNDIVNNLNLRNQETLFKPVSIDAPDRVTVPRTFEKLEFRVIDDTDPDFQTAKLKEASEELLQQQESLQSSHSTLSPMKRILFETDLKEKLTFVSSNFKDLFKYTTSLENASPAVFLDQEEYQYWKDAERNILTKNEVTELVTYIKPEGSDADNSYSEVVLQGVYVHDEDKHTNSRILWIGKCTEDGLQRPSLKNPENMELCRLCELQIPLAIFEAHTKHCADFIRCSNNHNENLDDFNAVQSLIDDRIEEIEEDGVIFQGELQLYQEFNDIVKRITALQILPDSYTSGLNLSQSTSEISDKSFDRSLMQLSQDIKNSLVVLNKNLTPRDDVPKPVFQLVVEGDVNSNPNIVKPPVNNSAPSQKASEFTREKAGSDDKEELDFLSSWKSPATDLIEERVASRLGMTLECLIKEKIFHLKAARRAYKKLQLLNKSVNRIRKIHNPNLSLSRSMSKVDIASPLSPRGPPSINDFEIVKPISKGAYGKVYLAKKRLTNDHYAIKVLKKADMIARGQLANIIAEQAILTQLDSPYVVKMYYSFQSKHNLYIVLEYLNGGDCSSMLKAIGTLDEEWSKRYIAEVVMGLESLHEKGIVHR